MMAREMVRGQKLIFIVFHTKNRKIRLGNRARIIMTSSNNNRNYSEKTTYQIMMICEKNKLKIVHKLGKKSKFR